MTSRAGSDGQWALTEGSTATSSPIESKIMPTRNPRMIVHAPSEAPSNIHYKFEVHFVLLFQGLVSEMQFGGVL